MAKYIINVIFWSRFRLTLPPFGCPFLTGTIHDML